MFIRMPRGFILPLLVALVLAGASASGQSSTSQAAAPERLQTPAEAADYQKGGTLYGPLMDFVYELQSRTELMHVAKLTRTLGGRDVVLCVLSNPPVFKPSDLAYQDKPVVLIVNNVHGGEVAGKDAAMAIMRDLVMGDLRPLLDQVIVLVVPTINPDGAEVRRRTNDEGFDMNRDYLKLESQEIQAVVTKVLNEWNPHIHLDTHHGGAAPYTLVFQTNMNPAGDQNLTRYGNERILSRVRAALRAEPRQLPLRARDQRQPGDLGLPGRSASNDHVPGGDQGAVCRGDGGDGRDDRGAAAAGAGPLRAAAPAEAADSLVPADEEDGSAGDSRSALQRLRKEPVHPVGPDAGSVEQAFRLRALGATARHAEALAKAVRPAPAQG